MYLNLLVHTLLNALILAKADIQNKNIMEVMWESKTSDLGRMV